jgi:hypothetical protein
MFSRMMITLGDDERAALMQMAESDYRRPQELLRYLLRTEAQKRGLLDGIGRATAERDGALIVSGG